MAAGGGCGCLWLWLWPLLVDDVSQYQRLYVETANGSLKNIVYWLSFISFITVGILIQYVRPYPTLRDGVSIRYRTNPSYTLHVGDS